jgi:hypothetical protein
VFILEYCNTNCLFVSLKDQTLKQLLLQSKWPFILPNTKALAMTLSS